MKKQKVIVLGIIALFIMQFGFYFVKSYETESEVMMNVEQISDNDESISGLGSNGIFDYYDYPEINLGTFTHEYTHLDITNLQKSTSYQSDEIEDSFTEDSYISYDITEYTTSAPLDTSLIFDFDYSYIDSSNFPDSYSTDYDFSSDVSKLEVNDNDYFEVTPDVYEIPSFTYTGTLVSGNTNSLKYNDNDKVVLDAYFSNPQYYATIGCSSLANYHYTNVLAEIYTSIVVDLIVITIVYTTGYPSVTQEIYYNAGGTNYYDIELDSERELYSIAITGQDTADFIMQVDYAYFMNKDCSFDLEYSYLTLKDESMDVDYYYSSNIGYTINGYSVSASVTKELATMEDFDLVDTFTFELSFDLRTDYLKIDYFYMIMNPLFDVNANIDYEIDATPYTENINLQWVFDTGTSMRLKIDSSQLSHYDYVSDLVITTQTIDVNYEIVAEIDVTTILSYTSNEYVIPSEANLKLNGFDVSDESSNSGFVDLLIYPETLSFTSDFDVLFEFDIVSYMSIDFNLDIISKTYLRTIFSLDSEHNLQVYSIQYLFDSLIIHSYVNNIDFASLKTIYPDYNWLATGNLKIEVLLSDSMYLPLGYADYDSYESNYEYSSITDGYSGYIESNVYPAEVTFSISEGYELTESFEEYYDLSDYSAVPDSVSESYGTCESSIDYSELGYSDENSLDLDSELVAGTDYKIPEGIVNWGQGSVPSGAGITYTYTPSIDSYLSHDYALKLDTTSLETCTYTLDSAFSYGYIDYFIGSSSTSLYCESRMICYDSSGNPTIDIQLYMGNIRFVGYAGVTNIGTYSVNTFYHISIIFDLTAGSYEGLSQYFAKVYINQVLAGTYETNHYNNLKSIKMSKSNGYNLNAYFDSIGISSLGYVRNSNYDASFYELDLDFSFDVSSIEADFENLQSIDFDYSYLSDIDEVEVSFQIYNEVIASYEVISNDVSYPDYTISNFEETMYETNYIDESGFIDIRIYALESSEYTITLDLLSITLNYFDSIQVSSYSYESIDLNTKEVSINENPFVSLEYSMEIDAKTFYEINIGFDGYLTLDISVTYEIPDNIIQISDSVTTDSTGVLFDYFYEADRDFSKWYIFNEYEVNSAEFIYDTNEIPFSEQDGYFYLDYSLSDTDMVLAELDLNPNFQVTSEVLDTNGTYINLQVNVYSDFDVSNVVVIVKDFSDYYDNWIDAVQSSTTKYIRFTEDLSGGLNTFELEGYRDIPEASFSEFVNEYFIIEDGFDESVNYNAYISYDTYSEAFSLDIPESWVIDAVHYGTSYYLLNNDIFQVSSGFDSSVTSSYLDFSVNPLISYTSNQLNDSIILSVNLSLNAEAGIIFSIEGIRSYKISNSSVIKLYSVNGVDYYLIEDISLDAGMNQIEIDFKVFNSNVSWYFAIPLVLGLAIYVIHYFYKNRKNRKVEL